MSYHICTWNFPDYTKMFYDSIKFDQKKVFKGIKSRNRIFRMPIIIVGTSGVGKTTLALNILSKIRGWYGKDKVKGIRTNDMPLKSLMKYAFYSLKE